MRKWFITMLLALGAATGVSAQAVTLSATGGQVTSTGIYSPTATPGSYKVIAKYGNISDTLDIAIKYPLPLPYGLFHSTLDLICSKTTRWTGTVRYGTSQWKAQLDSVRSCHGAVGLAPTSTRAGFLITDTSGVKRVSVAKWKAQFDSLWKPRTTAIKPYFDDQTIPFVYMMDEPNCSGCWSGAVITPPTVDSIACYVKSVWPFAKLAVRVEPQWFKGYNVQCIDISWSQMASLIHIPAAWTRTKVVDIVPKDTTLAERTKAEDSTLYLRTKLFADSVQRAAQAVGLAYVLGFNTLDGGSGPLQTLFNSKIGGTDDNTLDPNMNDAVYKDATGNAYRYQMSAGEIKAVTRALLDNANACAVLAWQYGPAYSYSPSTIAAIKAMDGKPEIIAAHMASVAKARLILRRPCTRP